MEKHTNQLREHGLKATYQRIKVLKYLDEHHTHPTVDQIYQDLVRENPSFSKTTIYNTIDALQQNGLIQTLNISGKEICCDAEIGFHHHFYCSECGAIIDINMSCPYLINNEIEGHHIQSIAGYFKGVCKDCLAKTNQ